MFCVYIAVLTVASQAELGSLMIAAFGAAQPVRARSLCRSWGGQVDWQQGITAFSSAFAMYAFFVIIRSNARLAGAGCGLARRVNMRSRIARICTTRSAIRSRRSRSSWSHAKRLAELDPERAAGRWPRWSSS